MNDLLNEFESTSKNSLFEDVYIPEINYLPSSSVRVLLNSKKREVNLIQEDLRKHYQVFNLMSPSLRELSSMSLVAGSLRDLCFDNPINDLDVYIAIDAEKVENLGKSFFVKEYSKLSLKKQEEFQNIIIGKFCGVMEKVHPNGFDFEKHNVPGRKLFVPPTVAQTKNTFDDGKFWDVFFEPNSFDFVNFFKASQVEMKIEMALVFLNNAYHSALEKSEIKIDEFYLSDLRNKEYSEANLSSFFKHHESVKMSSNDTKSKAKKNAALKYAGIHGLNAVLKLSANGFNYRSDIMFGFFPPALFISKFDFNISQMAVDVNEISLKNEQTFASSVKITQDCAYGIESKQLTYYFFFDEDLDAKSEKFTKRIKERMDKNKDLKMKFMFENAPLFDEDGKDMGPVVSVDGGADVSQLNWSEDMIKQFHRAQSFVKKQILNVKIENQINLTSDSGEDMINNSSFKL